MTRDSLIAHMLADGQHCAAICGFFSSHLWPYYDYSEGCLSISRIMGAQEVSKLDHMPGIYAVIAEILKEEDTESRSRMLYFGMSASLVYTRASTHQKNIQHAKTKENYLKSAEAQKTRCELYDFVHQNRSANMRIRTLRVAALVGLDSQYCSVLTRCTFRAYLFILESACIMLGQSLFEGPPSLQRLAGPKVLCGFPFLLRVRGIYYVVVAGVEHSIQLFKLTYAMSPLALKEYSELSGCNHQGQSEKCSDTEEVS